MEFLIETQEIQRIVNQLGTTAKANATDNSGRVLIEVSKDFGVVFTAVNPSTAITIVAENTTIKGEGSTAVLYSKLKAFISSFSPWDDEQGTKEFHFKLTPKAVTINVKNTHFGGKVSTGRLRMDIFQAYTIQKPAAFGEATFILNSDVIKSAANKIMYAINPNEARKQLRGMYLSFDEEYLTFAGTDGLKLSEYKVKNPSNTKEGGYILSYDYVMGLRRLIAKETQIFFEIKEGKIISKIDNVVYTGRLLIGLEYPLYEEEFTKYSDKLTINKDVLLNVIRPFMSVLNPEDNNRVCLRINDKQMTLFNDYAKFTCEEEVNFTKNLSVDINGSFMAQTVDAINDDKVVLKFSNDKGCLIFDSGTFEDQKALITPIAQRG